MNEARNPKRILFVDDDPLIREIAELALGSVGGFEVLLAAGGAEALKTAGKTALDLVVLDVNMPDLDGRETLAALSRSSSGERIPVVFLTAHHDTLSKNELMELGALAVLEKPFDPMTLADEIRSIMEGS